MKFLSLYIITPHIITTHNESCFNNTLQYVYNLFCQLACDRACDGCSGDGPDMCTKCADGHKLKDNICVSEYWGLVEIFFMYWESG